MHDIPFLDLKTGDRLEPSLNLQDVAMFDDDSNMRSPLHVVFWRRGGETRIRRRLVILDQELGITVDVFCVDTLHALFWVLLRIGAVPCFGR